MSALGLVAYDGSGSSSEDEDEPVSDNNVNINSTIGNQGQQRKTSSAITVNGAPSSSLTTKFGGGGVSSGKSSVIFSKFIDDEEDEIVQETKVSGDISDDEDALVKLESGANAIFSNFLPQPKKVPSEVEGSDDIEIGPIPPKKTYGDEELPQPPKPSSIASLSTSKVKGKVRISIPFLNSLDENEPSDDGEKRKIMQPYQKGSGLFALLPQPKNAFGSKNDNSNIFLKAKSANNNPSTSSVQIVDTNDASQNPQPQSSASMSRLIPDSVKNKLKRPAPSKLDEIRAKLSKKGPASATVSKFTKDSDSDDDDTGDFFSLDSTETIDPEALEKLKLPMQNFDKMSEREEAANYQAMDVDDQEYQNSDVVASSSSRSDDLMKFIQPKRGKKEEVKIIDINADDLRPDNTEWLRNITDESQAPARKSKGLGGMVKRKHQITYLAFEAKAREQELKNQWAQNRANKMATKNKYGF